MLLELGRKLESIQYNQLPEQTIKKSQSCDLEFFGSSHAGADAPLIMAKKAVWEGQNCGGNCVILGHKNRTSPLAAASINALMGQV